MNGSAASAHRWPGRTPHDSRRNRQSSRLLRAEPAKRRLLVQLQLAGLLGVPCGRIASHVYEVMPIPYDTNDMPELLKNASWISTMYGGDESATIRRHSTMSVTTGVETTSTRLIGRSAWNDKWMLVIPASSLSRLPQARRKRQIMFSSLNDTKNTCCAAKVQCGRNDVAGENCSDKGFVF